MKIDLDSSRIKFEDGNLYIPVKSNMKYFIKIDREILQQIYDYFSNLKREQEMKDKELC